MEEHALRSQILYAAEILEELQKRCPDLNFLTFISPEIGEDDESLPYVYVNTYSSYDDWHFIKNLVNELNDERFDTFLPNELPDGDFFGGIQQGDEDDN